MSIQTGDQLTAGVANKKVMPYVKDRPAGTAVVGRFYGYMLAAGNPGAMVAPTALAGSNTDGTTLAGAPKFSNATVGKTAYIADVEGTLSVAGRMSLYDMVWWNGGIVVTSTAAQTINTVALPERDVNGSINGDGLELWLYHTVAVGAQTPTITVSYTDSSGTPGRIATCVGLASAIAATMIPFNMPSGVNGVKSIESITLSASFVSGTIHLMLLRKLSTVDAVVAGSGQRLNFYDNGADAYDGTCIVGVVAAMGTALPVFIGSVSTVEG